MYPLQQLSVKKGSPLVASRSLQTSQKNTLKEFIELSGTFDFLERGLKTSGLFDWLREQKAQGKKFTIFAPTDNAFRALPQETRARLLANPTERLRDVLLYHIVVGDAQSKDLRSGRLKTVHGEDILVQLDPGGTILNGAARVIKPDIILEDGVVHTINTVLVP
jgi:uncharacterized surface protein with fasciclin (FAS1) repeats